MGCCCSKYCCPCCVKCCCPWCVTCCCQCRNTSTVNNQGNIPFADIRNQNRHNEPSVYQNVVVLEEEYDTLANPRRSDIVVKARFDYVPGDSQPDNMGFKKGDRMRISKEISDEYWYYAEHLINGHKGYIPKEQYVVPDNDDHTAEDWWFGEYTMRDAERSLLEPNVPLGSFIVRPSSDPKMYALSLLCHGKKVKHYRIRTKDNGRVYLHTNRNFKTLTDLVNFYKGKSKNLCCTMSIPYERTPETTPFRELEVNRSDVRLGTKIGSGNFGDVHKGKLCRKYDVAVKTMKKGTMTTTEFLREAEVMHELRHKRLLSIWCVCTKEEPVLMISEYMENGSLQAYLRKHQNLSSNELMDMACQISEGMAYLEGRKFVHRDLRAANILIGKQNVCKVADFGLARFFNKDEVYKATTPNPQFPIKWTAPECMKKLEFSTKSDVWSFGVLLHELFTKGGNPYPGMSAAEVQTLVLKGGHMDQSPDVPGSIYKVMTQCWQTNPRNRHTFSYLYSFFDDYLVSIEPNYAERF